MKDSLDRGWQASLIIRVIYCLLVYVKGSEHVGTPRDRHIECRLCLQQLSADVYHFSSRATAAATRND